MDNDEEYFDPLMDSDDIFSKYTLIKFFEFRSYKHLLSYQDIIEADFIDTLFEQRKLYKKKGFIAGLTLTFIGWNTFMSRFLLMNKFIFGFVAVKLGEKVFLHYHIDEIYDPLHYIYFKYYSLKLKN